MNGNLKLKQIWKKNVNFIIDCILILIGLVIIISGLIIQTRYHARRLNFFKTSFGMDYFQWLQIHKILIVMGTILIIFHIGLHWKWYNALLTKRIIKNNGLAITLNIIFILTAITGYYAWSLSWFNGDSTFEYLSEKRHIIEIHDKLGIVLTVLLFLHVKKRFRWLIETGKKFVKQVFSLKPIADNNVQ